MSNYQTQAIDLIDHRFIGRLSTRWLSRPFGARTKVRVIIYGHADPISRSQIEPFFRDAGAFLQRYGAEFRHRPIADLLVGKITDADVVLVQPWFTVSGEVVGQALKRLRDRLPYARIAFLDSYAHNDLRLARHVDPFIDLYYKKSIFRDRSAYLRPRRGDTNLTEYYGDLCGIDVGGPVDWHVPESILPKLRLSPNFLTSARFVRAFQSGSMPARGGRTIDLQSRLGGTGTPWYSAMRSLAQRKVEKVGGIAVSPPGHLTFGAFMAELENSKLCFSPFGYGELCWRDIEAFQTGSVLIKPDMSHLETLPDLYDPGVTYLSVRWDFSDLAETIRQALANENAMKSVAEEAWQRAAAYLHERRFVDDMRDLFAGLQVSPYP